ncbi:alpha-N-acetylgalactosaminidase [Condylostylus longicornis]|uniref:alpha-N-acetylgalactosaminidase n=1 Tax=Condylostylus longicornis TaxID=2530218 RepID=UPI00244E52F5|nr:alpha-N-acetylgalactosaminidase [Condylostylus longicornis]
MLFTKLSCSLILLLLILQNVNALENGLARTPPMGWMHWQRYRCIVDCNKYPGECINEEMFRKATDLLVSEGYKDAGYEYVIIDDCWMEMERDPITEKLIPDKVRFPDGLNPLADYIHAKGLKFGLYEDYGTHTCAGYPGVIGHMEIDAQSFADWKVDYVKLDGCYADIKDMDKGYPEFGRLLNKTGRPMVYSCSWPVYQEYQGVMPNYEALKEHCNLWRNWGDIDDSFESVIQITDYFAKNQDRVQPHGGPGHWNDPDMLILGNFGLSYEQSKTQMAIWAILAAPLIMSNDLASVKPEIKEILINKDVIAVNQDSLGIQGRRVKVQNYIEVWLRPIKPVIKKGNSEYHSFAVAFVSRRVDGHGREINITLSDIGMLNDKYNVVDLYDKDWKPIVLPQKEIFEARVIPNGVLFYKFTAIE